MKSLWLGCLCAVLALMGVGCATTPPQAPASQRWFLDPSVEWTHYRTYGFLQAMAVRYQDPVYTGKTRSGIFGFGRPKSSENSADIRHTDELIWRVLQDEMATKGYSQVAPDQADIVIIYYGGPRAQTPPESLRIQAHPFDKYFAQNELNAHTFWVDIVDNRKQELIYRGWDNAVFASEAQDHQVVVNATRAAVSFFPSKR